MNWYDEIEKLQKETESLRARVAQLELADAGFKSREEMSKALPIILELLKNPTFVKNAEQQGLKFDVVRIFDAFIDASGWKLDQPVLKSEKETKYVLASRSPYGNVRYYPATRREVIDSVLRGLLNTGWLTPAVSDSIATAIDSALEKAAI